MSKNNKCNDNSLLYSIIVGTVMIAITVLSVIITKHHTDNIYKDNVKTSEVSSIENTTTNPQEEISTQEENIIIPSKLFIGNEEIGIMKLTDDFKISNLSAIIDSGHYYTAMNTEYCIGIILQKSSMDESVNMASNINGYNKIEDKDIINNSSYYVKKVLIKAIDKDIYCSTIIINDKIEDKMIAISISGLSTMTYDSFTNKEKEFLSLYKYKDICLESEE